MDVNRLTVDEFFGWQRLVEGRYELVDGHIIPHPDYVTPAGFAAPDNDHAAVCANLVGILQASLKPPCRVYVGAGAVVDRVNANIPDVSVSCSEADRQKKAIEAANDTGRKVVEYLAIPTVEAYVVIMREIRSVVVYKPDEGPQTFASGYVRLGDGVGFDVADIFD